VFVLRLGLDAIENLIGKAIGQHPTKVTIVDGLALRRFFQHEHRICDRQQEFIS
jgi:hypothetical protein